MHPLGPLQRHQHALQARQQEQRQRHRADREDRGQGQRVGAEFHEHEKDRRRQNMPDDQDGQIGRTVIGALVIQRLVADRAIVAHLQIALQHRPRAASRAAAHPAAPQRRPERALGLFCGRQGLGGRKGLGGGKGLARGKGLGSRKGLGGGKRHHGSGTKKSSPVYSPHSGRSRGAAGPLRALSQTVLPARAALPRRKPKAPP